MKQQPTHQIIHRYLNRQGQVCQRANSKYHGTTDEEARVHFDNHVRIAQRHWRLGTTWNGAPVRITGVTLVDAHGTILATWTYQAEMAVAS